MALKVLIDGRLHDEADAKVSVLDRGFLYGDSVFEVMRTYGGRPFAEREHLERLGRSAERVLIPMPASLEVLSREIAETLAAADNDESYVRVVVTRGSGPLTYDLTTARDPMRVIIVTPLPPQAPETYEDGVAVALVRATRPTDESQATGAKASNYLSSLLAVHEARQRGAYEAILVGPGGEVLEGATSNIFAVREGRVRTPRVEAGILQGITRAHVMEAAAGEGVAVEETALFPRDLYDADEVFITSTLREVVPVVAADGHRIGTGRPGPMTRRLHAAFRRRAGV
jgi:branched-chain amino acid aminotransferase